MAINKKKVFIGAVVGLALLSVTSYFIWFRKPKTIGSSTYSPNTGSSKQKSNNISTTASSPIASTTIASKETSKPTVAPYTYSSKSFDGIEDIKTELYQKIVGTALYIDDAKDANSKKMKSMIVNKADQLKIGYWDALKAYLIHNNKGQKGLKEVIKSIGDDLEKHVNHVRKSGNFMQV